MPDAGPTRPTAPEAILNPRHVLEPTAGTGTWRAGFRTVWPTAQVKYVELDPELAQYSRNLGLDVETADILHATLARKYDLIVGNPPFSLAQEIIEHLYDEALAPGGTLAFLLRLNFFEGQERYPFWKKYPAARVFPCPARPGFTADGGTDGTGYMLCCWVKGYTGPTILEHMDNRHGPVRWNGQRAVTKDGRVVRPAVLDPEFPDPRSTPQPVVVEGRRAQKTLTDI